MLILMNQIPVYQISNAVSLLLYRFFMANILFQRFKCIGNLYHIYTNLILQFKNIKYNRTVYHFSHFQAYAYYLNSLI